MNDTPLAACVIMLLCGFGCAMLFQGIALWAEQRKEPVHFYSGTTVDPRTISDIPAYNRANARLWKLYAIPYWLSGLLSLLGIWVEYCLMAGVICLLIGGIPGSFWLIFRYEGIHRESVPGEERNPYEQENLFAFVCHAGPCGYCLHGFQCLPDDGIRLPAELSAAGPFHRPGHRRHDRDHVFFHPDHPYWEKTPLILDKQPSFC